MRTALAPPRGVDDQRTTPGPRRAAVFRRVTACVFPHGFSMASQRVHTRRATVISVKSTSQHMKPHPTDESQGAGASPPLIALTLSHLFRLTVLARLGPRPSVRPWEGVSDVQRGRAGPSARPQAHLTAPVIIIGRGLPHAFVSSAGARNASRPGASGVRDSRGGVWGRPRPSRCPRERDRRVLHLYSCRKRL
jgi:hypothetical protein